MKVNDLTLMNTLVGDNLVYCKINANSILI